MTIPLYDGSPANLTLSISDDLCVYPVTLNGTAVDYDTDIPLDLSTPQTLTVTGPYLSRTYTLTASP